MKVDFAMWRKALNVIPEVSKSEWGGLDLVSRWLISSRAAVLIMTFLSSRLAFVLGAGRLNSFLAYAHLAW
jgi:1,4-dihydroxy-2-naphthoate octaprenyltransferase